MRIHLIAAALLASGASAPAWAQCLECAQQMFQATLTSNVWYNINQDQIDQTRSGDARNGLCYDANRHLAGCRETAAAGVPGPVADQAEGAVMAVLGAEYQRRVRSGGAGNANAWFNKAAGDVGRQVAALNADYRRRAAADDRAAGAWYIDNARRIAQDQVAARPGTGPGDSTRVGGIPAATRERAENATFAVLEPGIARLEKTQGKAKAIEWARAMGTAVGSGVRNLAPEYAQRERANGRARADEWYVDQARRLALHQVAHDGR